MTMLSDHTQKLSRGSAFVGWVKDVTSRLLNRGELQGIDGAEFEQIARDLNLSPPELHAISAKSSIAVDLLNKRMAKFGLSSAAVRRRYPKVLRDMQRVCGLCSSRRQCLNKFAKETSDADASDDCPNTLTLQELERENLTTERQAYLPIGPSCC